MKDADFVAFLQWALPRLRMRWSGFRKVRKQVNKRLTRRLKDLGLSEVGEYRLYLETHPKEWRVLDGLCRITISRFLRDRRVMLRLQEEVLPELAEAAGEKGQEVLNCWSAGCGSGEEPFSLSLLWRMAPVENPSPSLATRFPNLSFRITATDAEPKVLDRARQGLFPGGALREVPASWVQAAFDEGASGFTLKASFRVGVSFLLQDVREAANPGQYALILCRNLVFTYFDDELQEKILARLVRSLEPGGYLVLGGHERLPLGSSTLEQKHPGFPLYRKEGAHPFLIPGGMEPNRQGLPAHGTRKGS